MCSVMNTGVHEGLLDIGEFQTRIRDPSGRVEEIQDWSLPRVLHL